MNRFAWRTRAFCLMPNHFHLVVSTPRIELSAGMHRLNCLYAMRFNKRNKRSGHLFQNRFDARLVEGDRHAAGRLSVRREQPGSRRASARIGATGRGTACGAL